MLLAAASGYGQTAPVLELTDIPGVGESLIASDGSVYRFGSTTKFGEVPVTPGAAQSQPNQSTCTFGGPFGVTSSPCSDIYLLKLSPAGEVVYGTFLGGDGNDWASAAAIDVSGNLYVAGTAGADYPGFGPSPGKSFVAKLNADGSAFLWNTDLPDSIDSVAALAVDGEGSVYLAGGTTETEAYVAKLAADGSAVLYETVLGGGGSGGRFALAVTDGGIAVVAGLASANFPLKGDLGVEYAGGVDAFVVKLDAAGQPVAAKILGGSGGDAPNALRVGGDGSVYVGGSTDSLDFPVTDGTFQPEPRIPAWTTSPGGFLVKLTPELDQIVYGTYVPVAADSGDLTGVVELDVDPEGRAVIAGASEVGFPVTESAPQICYGGKVDQVVARLDPAGRLLDATYLGSDQPRDQISGLRIVGGSIEGVLNLQQRFRLVFGSQDWKATPCLSQDPVSPTDFRSSQLAPGQLLTLRGFGIGPEQGVSYVNGDPVPTQLGGVEVRINGVPAPLLYVQSRQINLQVPYESIPANTVAIGADPSPGAEIQVYYGSHSFKITNLGKSRFAHLGWFRLQPNVSRQLLAIHEDGTLNGPDNPAKRGSVVSFWGSGFGAIVPACSTGGYNPYGPAPLVPNVEVYWFGAVKPERKAQYAGGAPTFPCGVYQVNLRILEDSATGEVQVSPTLLEQWFDTDGMKYFNRIVDSGGGTIWIE